MDFGELVTCGTCEQGYYANLGHACPGGPDPVTVRDLRTGEVVIIPFAVAAADDARYRWLVLDVNTDEIREMHRLEAAAGMYEFGESLGAGTPGCAVRCARALDVASDNLRYRRKTRKAVA